MSNSFAALEDDAGFQKVDKRASSALKNQQKNRKPYPEAAAAAAGGRPPKRQFDRHSGTGRGKEMKRDGAGKYNWGSDAQAGEDAVAAVAEAAEAKDEGEVVVEPVPEEPVTKSLEDHFKHLMATRPAEDNKKARQAQADEKFKGDQLVKEDQDDEVMELINAAKNGVDGKKVRNKNKNKKQVLNLDFKVAANAAPAPRGDRPERGDRPPRGDRPHRGDRPPRADGERGPRQPRGDRPPRADGERGPRQPRGDRPPRADGERGPRQPRGDRPQGERGPRQPRGDRPQGERGPARNAGAQAAPRRAQAVASDDSFPALGGN